MPMVADAYPSHSAPLVAADVWQWRPPRDRWYAGIQQSLKDWAPATALEVVGVAELRRALESNCAEQAEWLMHPSLNAALFASDEHRLERDFAFLAWMAAHTDVDVAFTASRELLCWAPDGGFVVPTGRHQMQDLRWAPSEFAPPLAIDPWCASTGFPLTYSWPTRAGDMAMLEDDLRRYCAFISAFRQLMPRCFEWVASATKVVIPLQRGEGLHSSSAEEFPGLIALDIPQDLVVFVELVVHESAHRHLYIADAGAPLVSPDHDALYPSPLRRDPRPLRAVLLAYHALAYIAAAYREAAAAGLLRSEELARERIQTIDKLNDARSTVDGARMHFTPDGLEFLRQTELVADYGCVID